MVVSKIIIIFVEHLILKTMVHIFDENFDVESRKIEFGIFPSFTDLISEIGDEEIGTIIELEAVEEIF